MARPKQKITEYTIKGVFVADYESESDARNKHFSSDKSNRPLWSSHPKLYFLQNGNVLTKGKLGRDFVIDEVRKFNDPFKIKLGNKTKPVFIYNENNELIAEFATTHIASILLKINEADIWTSCNKSKKIRTTKNGIYFSNIKQ